VQLDLHAAGASEIAKLSERLERIPNLETVPQIGDVHHISLAVYEDLSVDRFLPDLAKFAAGVRPIVVQLANLGIFYAFGACSFSAPL
jgi:hypothetical protein